MSSIPYPQHGPTIVSQRRVKSGDMDVTASTVRIQRGYYDTVIFDNRADKRHDGAVLTGHEHEGTQYGPYIINKSSVRSSTRDEAMDQHREALYAARTETPKQAAR